VFLYGFWSLTLHNQIEVCVFSLAGRIPPELGWVQCLTPPFVPRDSSLLPGGDMATFIRALVFLIEALVLETHQSVGRGTIVCRKKRCKACTA